MLGLAALVIPHIAFADGPSPASPRWSSTVFAELSAGYVPFANDVPLMLGIGVRASRIHEVWARLGYMPVGDDRRHAFGVIGYRAALRFGKVVRPVVGGYVAGLPATCGHDDHGRPKCSSDRLFIFAATGGVRFEPTPWIGFSALVSLGVDTYPNPFGMAELGVMVAPPLGW